MATPAVTAVLWVVGLNDDVVAGIWVTTSDKCCCDWVETLLLHAKCKVRPGMLQTCCCYFRPKLHFCWAFFDWVVLYASSRPTNRQVR